MVKSSNVVDFDDSLRIIGTAHVSSKSVALVKEQISEYSPDVVAVELCESRMASLMEPESLDSEDLLKIIKEGKSAMIILQTALAAEQRRMGVSTGEKPGAELLAAVLEAREANIPVEMVDRDVVSTLRRAWGKMSIREKWRVLDTLLWAEEDEEEVDLDDVLEDTDLLSNLMEEARSVAPGAGEVLIDERDEYISGRIKQIREGESGRVLAIVGAGHINGIVRHLSESKEFDSPRMESLIEMPRRSIWPKAVMWGIPMILVGACLWMIQNGHFGELRETAETWLILNAAAAGVGVAIARGHPLSVIVGAVASPITSLNPTVAAGWFAGYTQLKVASPTGKDASDFLTLDSVSLLWKNRVGKVLLVTALGNIGSSLGAIIAGGAIFGYLIELLGVF
ncbi:MAG: hypothetical protein CMB58_001515 [Methanobacteriota archaeon]|nr:hypothetical protein [Euryarchaeota archaeon]MBC94805.1 hypothetical protein [Euryarchaeota archaeon]RAH17174.1 MAG: hypothetical protein CMB58_001515 [Euryarchaeota archaeon]|tara:strand:+ start:6542 stop:7729 length:1188 start_codon:yes stop_codon:yes gene_type:complete